MFRLVQERHSMTNVTFRDVHNYIIVIAKIFPCVYNEAIVFM